MKKVLKIIGFIILLACAVASAWMTVHELQDYSLFSRDCEKISYILLAGVFLVSFAYFSKKTDKLWGKFLLGFSHSAMYIVTMFFENSFYQTIYLNGLFKTGPEITYAESLKMSWHYYISKGSPHYTLVFFAMLALCALIILWRIPKFVKFRSKLFNRIFMPEDDTTVEIKEYASVEEAVSDLDNNTHMIDSIQYLIHLEKTEENKQELIRCAEEYRLDTLFDILFDSYKEMLTQEEYIKLRTAFRVNSEEIISSYEEQINMRVHELDEYYGIGDIGK